jgi:hypothetical protein
MRGEGEEEEKCIRSKVGVERRRGRKKGENER